MSEKIKTTVVASKSNPPGRDRVYFGYQDPHTPTQVVIGQCDRCNFDVYSGETTQPVIMGKSWQHKDPPVVCRHYSCR